MEIALGVFYIFCDQACNNMKIGFFKKHDLCGDGRQKRAGARLLKQVQYNVRYNLHKNMHDNLQSVTSCAAGNFDLS